MDIIDLITQIDYICKITFSLYQYSSRRAMNKKRNTGEAKRLILGRGHAQRALNEVLLGYFRHNLVGGRNRNIIDNEDTALKIAEIILFSIYTEENIVRQRPYEIYLIDHYWVISGTIPEGYRDGTFLIIINAQNAQILQVTHG